MKRLRYSLGFPLAGVALLSGCAVYAPTVPSTPLLTAKGQVELTAGLRGLNSLEAGGAWSPATHWAVIGESALQSSTTETTTNNVTTTYRDYHRQAGLGLGYYRVLLASRLYWAAVGGAGFAAVSLHSIDFAIASPYLPLPFPYISGHYQAQYRRYYGQLYVAQPLGERFTGGVSVRGTWVDYSQLTLDGQSVEPTNRFFLEPTLFMRFGRGPIQAQGTLGLSLPTSGDKDNPLNKRTAPVSGLVSIGVVFRPDLLRHGE